MNLESGLLRALLEAPENRLTVNELVSRLKTDQSLVMAAAVKLKESGLVEIIERTFEELSPGLQWSKKLPERSALERLGGESAVELSRLPVLLAKDDVRAEVKWLTRKGWFSRERDRLVLTEKGRQALAGAREPDELVLEQVQERVTVPELKKRLAGVDVETGVKLLRGREELVRIRQRVERVLKLTEAGISAAQRQAETGGLTAEVTQLTPELITSGRWRQVRFRRYDVSLPAKEVYPGKEHPLGRIISEARRAFLEMGFEETASPVVETAFWDFDALFQPQDHPAREMQDTFYLAVPRTGRLPDPELVARVAQTHENGGETGSRGWQYRWQTAAAERLLLRTHTTAATIRALAQNPSPPRKVFCIGRVFRRENMDATHLPEFIQIDGIIIDERASLVTLFGTLAEFYRKMGASEVRFRPSYFPYTEPSVEVFANLGRLGWVEMGGAGVFRPEVTIPLGCRATVLAWGLGLERLAMLRFGVSDIRKLYWADIGWLREAKLCR
ncbi:MAG: phenylalanine--tRNA ligase subunit alpha [candidate division WOR-3 bacterium]|nr:phenylalanine--tRNA ligase subunit alpha [candidate division WOR-3 bacterium]